MQISTRGRYAVMAMADLAFCAAGDARRGAVSLGEIAARQQLSLAYLEQLFGKLRRADLVHSARGPGGGYRLARMAEDIAIAEIVAAVHEPLQATRCIDASGGCLAAHNPGTAGAATRPTASHPAARGAKCQTHDLWFELGRQITLFLGGITLADVVHGQVVGRAIEPPPSLRVAIQHHESD